MTDTKCSECSKSDENGRCNGGYVYGSDICSLHWKKKDIIPEQEPDEEQPEEKRGRGRPRKYTPRQLKARIAEYFDSFGPEGVIVYPSGRVVGPTVSGLALSLDVDRLTLVRWATDDNDEYCIIARDAISRMEKEFENELRFGKSPSGAAFWLRNHKWGADIASSKTEVSANDGQGKELKVIIREVKDVPFNPEGGQ